MKTIHASPIILPMGMCLGCANTITTEKEEDCLVARVVTEIEETKEEYLKTAKISDELKDDQIGEIRNLLVEFQELFARSLAELKTCNVVKHRIYTEPDQPPIHSRPYRLPQAYRAEVETQITDLLRCGILKESHSPWSSPLVVVKKPDGKLRLCVDYRRLNAVSKLDQFPLPLIGTILDSMSGSQLFTTLDLHSGFHQIAMAEEDKGKNSCDKRTWACSSLNDSVSGSAQHLRPSSGL